MVTLADGRAWGLASPTVRHRLEVVADGDELGGTVDRLVAVTGFGHPPEILAAVERLNGFRQARAATGALYEAFFSLAVALLRRAHDLDLVTARGLLEVPDDRLLELAEAVMSVAVPESFATVALNSDKKP